MVITGEGHFGGKWKPPFKNTVGMVNSKLKNCRFSNLPCFMFNTETTNVGVTSL